MNRNIFCFWWENSPDNSVSEQNSAFQQWLIWTSLIGHCIQKLNRIMCDWFIMQCCTNVSVSSSVSANTNLNLAADVVPHRCDWIKYIKYYSFESCIQNPLGSEKRNGLDTSEINTTYTANSQFSMIFEVLRGNAKKTPTVKMCWNFLDFSNTPSSLSPVNIYRQISHSINQS